MKHFKIKLVLMGTNLEIRSCENTQYFNFEKNKFTSKSTIKKKLSLQEKKAINKKNTNKAIKEVKSLIASNYCTDNKKANFFTFTFNENVSKEQAKNKLKLFNKKLKYHYKYSAKYVGVSEFQQNGNIHLHIVYFGFPVIPHDILKKIWSYGSIYIKTIENSENSFNNIAKYMLKDKLNNSRRFFTSKNNLKRPIIVRNDLVYEKINHLLKNCNMNYVYTGENEFLGAYTIKSLDLSRLSSYEKDYINTVLLNSL